MKVKVQIAGAVRLKAKTLCVMNPRMNGHAKTLWFLRIDYVQREKEEGFLIAIR